MARCLPLTDARSQSMMLYRPERSERPALSTMASAGCRRGKASGQIVVIVCAAIVTLIGAVALSTDVAIHYYHWVQLQKAADAGALAGASYLPDNTAQAVTTCNDIVKSN